MPRHQTQPQSNIDETNPDIARWTAGNMGGLTTTHSPFSGRNTDGWTPGWGGLATGLPKGLSNEDLLKDETVLDELAKRDPKFARKLALKRIEDVQKQFLAQHPSYLPTADNLEAILKYLRKNVLKDPSLDLDDVDEILYAAKQWNVEILSEAFAALVKTGRLEMPAATPKSLTAEEKLAVTLKVHLNPLDAISQYLALSLPSLPTAKSSIESLCVQYPALISEAVWFVFRQMNPQISPADFDAFQNSMAHVSIPSLAALQMALQSRTEQAFFSPGPIASATPAELTPREMTREELEQLSPEELDRLIRAEQKALSRR